MSEYQAVDNIADLELLDQDEMVQGYREGWDGAPEPGSDKSKSYWHGWRNAMIDTRRMEPDAASDALVRQYMIRHRSH